MKKNQRVEFIPINESSMSGEIWMDIEDYEGIYQISNKGRVRRLCGDYCNIRATPNRGDGYCKITLSTNNRRESRYVHRMVAQAFIQNPNNYPCVNHKDENKNNNGSDNLEWCTYQYNSLYGTSTKRQKETRIKNDPQKIGWRKTVETRNRKKCSRAEIPVRVEKTDGTFVGEYKSLTDAAKAINAKVHEISTYFKEGRKSVRGCILKKIK